MTIDHSLHRQNKNGTQATRATMMGKKDDVSSAYGFSILEVSLFFLLLLVSGGGVTGSSFSIGLKSSFISSSTSPDIGGSFGTSKQTISIF